MSFGLIWGLFWAALPVAAQNVPAARGEAQTKTEDDVVIIVDDEASDTGRDDQIVIINDDEASDGSGDDDVVIIHDDEATDGGGSAGGDDDVVIIHDGEASDDDSDDEIVIIDDASDADSIVVSDDEDSEDSNVVVIDDSEVDSEDDGGFSLPFKEQNRTWLTIELTSRAMMDTSFETSTREDVIEWWNVGRCRLDYKAGNDFRAIAEVRARWGVTAEDTNPENDFFLFNARNPKWTGEVELREAYLSFDLWGIDIEVGNRIYVWGKNEVYASADIMNPMDMRYDLLQTLASTKEGKVPIFAVDVAYDISDVRLQLVVAPFFTSHKVALFGRDFSAAAPGSQRAAQLQGMTLFHPSIEDQLQTSVAGTEVPEESFENMTVAARAKTSLFGWDFAATVYFGWDRTPNLQFDRDLLVLARNADRILDDMTVVLMDAEVRDALLRLQQRLQVGEELISVTYDRQWIFALEAEGVVGDFVLRFDIGASPQQGFFDESMRYLRRPNLNGAIGGEYTYGQEWYVGLTTFASAVFNAPKNARLTGLEPTRLDPGQRDVAAMVGVATTVRYLWEDQNIEVQATGLFTINPGDIIGTAQIAYKDLEPHQFKFGGVFIWGDKGGMAHDLRNNNFLYLEYQSTW